MASPDRLVNTLGEGVMLTRVVDYATGRDGVDGVTREVEPVSAYVSSPSETQAQRLEGRLSDGAITCTFVSDVDVMADRPGGRDRLIRPDPETDTSELTLVIGEGETETIESGTTATYNGVELGGELSLQGELQLTDETLSIPEDARIYTAVDVTEDRHPMVGLRKLTVVYNELGGRQDLADDAEIYTDA